MSPEWTKIARRGLQEYGLILLVIALIAIAALDTDGRSPPPLIRKVAAEISVK